jgi:hypothetical protein
MGILKGRVAILFMVAALASADTYSRTTNLSALRMGYDDLRGLAATVSAFVLTANSGVVSCAATRDSLRISDGQTEVEVQGEPFNSTNLVLPATAYQVQLSYYCPDAPVAQVDVLLSDFSRRVIVRGTRPDQVDGLSALVTSKLAAASTFAGGLGFRIFLLCALVALGSALVNFSQRKPTAWLGLAIIVAAFAFYTLATFGSDHIFSGFALYSGEVSIIRRYAPEWTFAGLFLTILSMSFKRLSARFRTLVSKRANHPDPADEVPQRPAD